MSAPAIAVRGLTKSFGSVDALTGVDFEVDSGSVYALLGPNGAGKTTTVRILATLLEPDGGAAEVAGVDVTGDPAVVRRSVGLAGQFAAVDPNLTGRENLRFVGRLTHVPRAELGGRVSELLARFDLDAAADRLVRTYSGGMRRRLDLAAALIHRPPILFLDEPTAGLDPTTRQELWALVESLVGDGATVLLTTHYLEEADRLADRVGVLDAGSIIAEGTAAQLKAQLGASALIVEFAENDGAARAGKILAALGQPEAASADGREVTIRVEEPSHAILEAVRLLDRAELVPKTVRIDEPTLDDVFLATTGRTSAGESDRAVEEVALR